MQDAGARRVSNAEGIRRIVRKHDCALPAQYTKHSNARGHSLAMHGLMIMITRIVLILGRRGRHAQGPLPSTPVPFS